MNKLANSLVKTLISKPYQDLTPTDIQDLSNCVPIVDEDTKWDIYRYFLGCELLPLGKHGNQLRIFDFVKQFARKECSYEQNKQNELVITFDYNSKQYVIVGSDGGYYIATFYDKQTDKPAMVYSEQNYDELISLVAYILIG